MECPICYVSLSRGETRTTACGHVFHTKCLDAWYRRSTSCPMCRAVSSDAKCTVAMCTFTALEYSVMCTRHLNQNFQKFEVAQRMMAHSRDKRTALVHQLLHIIRPTGITPFTFNEKYNEWRSGQPSDRVTTHEVIVID